MSKCHFKEITLRCIKYYDITSYKLKSRFKKIGWGLEVVKINDLFSYLPNIQKKFN